MHRLPTKTTPPARMGADGPEHNSNGHAVAAPGSSLAAQLQSAAAIRPLKLLRFPAIRERTGLSRSTIWRMERNGEFPKHRRISANAVAWVEEEVLIWMRSKVGELAV